MSKMTKAQQKRMVRDILSKTQKLFVSNDGNYLKNRIVNGADMNAIEKLTSKWMNRIG